MPAALPLGMYGRWLLPGALMEPSSEPTQRGHTTRAHPTTGKTFLGTQLVRTLLRNTRNSSPSPRDCLETGTPPPPPPPPAHAPDVGSILLVTFTNHALDEFLERLLDAGITDLVRVGGRSRSARLEAYNLRALQRGRAGGMRVGLLLEAVGARVKELQALIEQRKRTKDARSGVVPGLPLAL